MAATSARRLSAIRLPTSPEIDMTYRSHAKRTSLTVLTGPEDDDKISESHDKVPFSPDKAAYALIFAVFAHGVNVSCVLPNLPSMCTPGMDPDSFASIEPWTGIASAQYFILMATSTATVMSGFFFGWLANKIGYRRSFMILASGSVLFTLARYFARGSYWSFAAVSFVNSCFGGTVVVGNGYVGNVFNDRFKIDGFIGYLLGALLLSSSLGGLLTLVFPDDLFLPLIPAAAISFTALVVIYFFVLDPVFDDAVDHKSEQESEVDDVSQQPDVPEKLNKAVLANIVIGAFIDNIGSLGIYPLAFSPVMYQKFFSDFEMQSLTPVMSENQYRLLFSLILITAAPSSVVAPFLYKRFGIAATCVMANIMTAVIILGLVWAAAQPASEGSFALFASIIYLGVPLAVISNLSTGPMLDRVSPRDFKNFAQGINTACYSLANAFFPIIFGIVSDTRGYTIMLYMLAGIQALASLVNLPLMFNPRLRRDSTKKPDEDASEGTGWTDGTGSAIAKEEELSDVVDDGKSIEVNEDVESAGCSLGKVESDA